MQGARSGLVALARTAILVKRNRLVLAELVTRGVAVHVLVVVQRRALVTVAITARTLAVTKAGEAKGIGTVASGDKVRCRHVAAVLDSDLTRGLVVGAARVLRKTEIEARVRKYAIVKNTNT